MILQLLLTLSGINKYYGHIPETYGHSDKIEEFELENDDREIDWYLDEHFAIPINEKCNSILGYGDVDFLDAEKCKVMIPWLKKNIKSESRKDIVLFYNKLLEFSNKAIELKTGIIIEM